MWVDKRGNFHIINHRYGKEQTHCYNSTLRLVDVFFTEKVIILPCSAHTFSPDGKSWHVISPPVEPYSHTVQYDDGTSKTFVALERPNIYFNGSGVMTHINLVSLRILDQKRQMYDFLWIILISMQAADLTTTDAGCGSNSCDYCKFLNHCGTVIIALDV